MPRIDLRGRIKLRQYDASHPYRAVRTYRITHVLMNVDSRYPEYHSDYTVGHVDADYCLDRAVDETVAGAPVLRTYRQPSELYNSARWSV